MPDVNVKGRYRIYTHDGVEPLLFTTYSNQLCSIRRPNPNTFITISTYIPGSLSPFTTFDPGSSYTIVTKSNTADFSMGPYTRVDRLPSSVTFRSPNFYHGLDKNSITVALSSYALSVNAPLSTAFTYIPGQDGYFINSISFNTQRLKEGLPSLLTHLTPGSSYQFINRTPFTFFAPLESEMGDAYATGYNVNGQLGMGYQYNSFGYTQLYGNWDKVVTSVTHAAALSTCGTTKKLFVCGGNTYGQLGLTNVDNAQPTLTATQTVWKQLQNIWTWDWNNDVYRDILLTENILDAEVGTDFTLIRTDVQLYGCGRMCNMGIAPPGSLGPPDQFNGVGGDSFTNHYVPYFTSYLNRSTALRFTTTQGPDSALYYQIPSNNIKKFQARDLRWYWLDAAGRLYGAGKMSGTTGGLGGSSSSPGILPIGQSSTSTATNYASIVQLYGPGDPSTRYNNQFFSDFNASPTNIVALSSNYITWVAGGATSGISNSSSLSTICFFDPVQNAYVPQNDYFLRLLPTFYGYMGIVNGKLYFSGSATYNGVNGAGDSVASRLPASTLPRLNGALGANPQESLRFRSLIPLTYMGQPDISWKSLNCGQLITAAIDSNNKLYVCGNNANGYLGAPSNPTSNLITTLTQIILDNIYNVNANDLNLVVYKTNRNPATSPVPVPSPTPTPSVTPQPQPVYNTGEVMYSRRGDNTENTSYWFNDIQYSNAIACGTQVAGVYPYKMMIFELVDYSAPPSAQQYDHFSYRMIYNKPQIEPQSFGSRKCFVFSASPSVGGVTGGNKDLCFHYFSQTQRPDLSNCVLYPTIISKMAPNSGTFGDGKSSRQRMEIKTNVGDNCLVDFYIKPEDNSYHVIFTDKTNPATSDIQTRTVYPYYTKSTNRGTSWSTPLLLGANYYNPITHDWYPCNTGGYVPNTVDPAITNKKGNADKPAVLFMEQYSGNPNFPDGGVNTAYSVACKYTYNNQFDRKVTLASGYLYAPSPVPAWYYNAPRLDFDPQFAHFKILYDNANRLITLWTGTAGPYTQMDRYNYIGQGRSRIVYRYLSDEDNNTWSPLVTACRTFPHSNYTVASRPFVDVGRYWDACIDDSDNNLCILYTPDPSNSGGYSFSAFVAKVIKINISTGQTIYDETVLDITSSPMGVSYYPKSIGSVNLYYDSQLNKLVAQCFTRNIQGQDGRLYRMQRNSTNNWSEIPYLGASGGIFPNSGSFSYNWMTVQRNLRT